MLRRQPPVSRKQGEVKKWSLWIAVFIQQQLSGGSSSESAFNGSWQGWQAARGALLHVNTDLSLPSGEK